MYLTKKEREKEIREKLKALGITSKQVSVRGKHCGYSTTIDCRIKDLAVSIDKAKEIAEETVNYFKKFVKEVQVDLRYDIDEATEEVVVKVFEK